MTNAIKSPIYASTSCRRNAHGRLLVSLGLLMLLATAVTSRAAAIVTRQQEAGTLEPGKAVMRELSGGEAHAYQFTLRAGQYAQVDVEQRRINISLIAFDAHGRKIVESDMFSIGETEFIAIVAEADATYRVEVRSPDKTAPRGSYEIKLRELREARDEDKSFASALRLAAEGVQIGTGMTAEAWRKTLEKYEQAASLFHSARNLVWEATALYMTSSVYTNLGEKQKALEFAERALAVAQEAARQPGEEAHRLGIRVEALTLNMIGRIYNEFGDKKKALEKFNEALPLLRAAGDRMAEANALNDIAMAYQYMGEYQKSFGLLNQVRQLLSDLGDRRKEAAILNNLCVIESDLGENKKALDYCTQALALRRELADKAGEAIVLDNLGSVYAALGQYQTALDLYNQTSAIYKGIAYPQGQGIALNNIAWLYATVGEYQKAIDIYTEALEIFRAAGDQYREANVLGNIAANYADLKDFRKALEINERVLALRRAVNNRQGEAITLNNIAGCYSNLGEKQKALDYYNQSIALHRATGNPRQLASALKNLGALYKDLGEEQKALDLFGEALQLSRNIGDRNLEAGVLSHLARFERDRGNLAAARQRIEEALAAVESLRINLKSQQLRASFFASVRKYHEFYIDLLMRLHKERPSEGFDAAAFAASERGRARSLLELLAEARAEIRQGVDPQFIEREHELRQLISAQADRQMRLLSGKYTPDEAAALTKQIDSLTTEYEQLQSRIREASPRYAALVQPAPLSPKEIQSAVLDDETLLLEYSLGEEKSFLWAVTPQSIRSFELPKRETIEASARRVYETLTARNQVVAGEGPEQRRKRLEEADAEYGSAVAALSRMLLGQAAAELKQKRLLIVGEGMLQYIPFTALPNPSQQSSPLIVTNEIVTLPSASVLAELRRETQGRKSAERSVAVFADPVFERIDPRIASVNKGSTRPVEEAASLVEVKRSATESGLRDFVRLRFSRQEADEITRLAGGRTMEALGFSANREAALKPDVGRYRFLHFATHALINNQHPELSGVVLSLFDEQGRPQNGFLRLYDIYNLKLDADLVVLSACQTALGREVMGEGLVGLTRGFMYAGSPRVVASLWQIDDRATAELMKRFYDGMLVRGLRPAAALRAAQVSMWSERRWAAPQYWAAFTLEGEWR